jgi:integrase
LTKAQIKKLCNEFAAEGFPYKASNTHAAVKSCLGWAEEQGLVKVNVMLGATCSYERRSRDKVYSDDDIKAIWRAADRLKPLEGGYVKLLLLLAPRKTALALMRKSHLEAPKDDPDNFDTWITPFELHTTAMDLLQQGVEQSVIALWLGHESIETTQVYLDTNLELKQRALDAVTPLNGKPGRYRPDDRILAFLNSL